ncbi:hypothetical protein M8756_04075 [Lutimaribacter sp. EGI FJ00015]|uniref:Uncharacterized protein n=1 Tax=Lutimaribacter degradans TaxID=2945989 RepID=A0ACC5ZQM8_9RHOB|nr:hypothetical protein [Lutimaribacter sp. EGI FJ00013]MCO0612475.1 hypothetical protein [Lutimaribacter sp. EGI FJ00015]MCO0634406.1 hypothetical protein [Lutimaribacter sp. EGI FJ00014]
MGAGIKYSEFKMDEAATDFQKRLKRIGKRHARLEHGYVSVVGEDGLIITKPKRKSGGFPLRVLATLVLCFFGFKILLISQLGPEGYATRVDLLKTGTVIEQGGAWLLQADPVSLAVADGINKLTL